MRSRYFHTHTLAALAFALTLCAASETRVNAHDPRAHAEAKEEVVYTCPMHPEVKSKKKGACPKCKMDLRPARAESQAAEVMTAGHGDSQVTSKMSIPDVELLDQDGRTIHFYSDLVKGKTVAVNFIFTTCTTICPPLGATFARVQRDLGERAGQDVRLISVSVDPATDTPERLKAWGEKFHAGPGWTLVTGPKPQVDELLRALGAATASPQDHSPTVLVGNDATGRWTRAYGLARPAVLLGLIDAAGDSTGKEAARQ
ncbi:MAG: SCO family protein [Acidobacteria bacterium]|nr:SCO family protein [Acidobacteriota bacterium]